MAYTSTTFHPRGVLTGGRLVAASSNKTLVAATWVDLLAASITTSKPVSQMRVWIVASPTQYGLYLHRYSAATHIQRERLHHATGNIFYAHNGMQAIFSATKGEYINFRLGTPYTPMGHRASGGHIPGNDLRKIIVEELD